MRVGVAAGACGCRCCATVRSRALTIAAERPDRHAVFTLPVGEQRPGVLGPSRGEEGLRRRSRRGTAPSRLTGLEQPCRDGSARLL